jgi:hypothetical protein
MQKEGIIEEQECEHQYPRKIVSGSSGSENIREQYDDPEQFDHVIDVHVCAYSLRIAERRIRGKYSNDHVKHNEDNIRADQE